MGILQRVKKLFGRGSERGVRVDNVSLDHGASDSEQGLETASKHWGERALEQKLATMPSS